MLGVACFYYVGFVFLAHFSAYLTVCFLHFCRCRCELLLTSRCRFTPVFAAVSCSCFCLDLLWQVKWGEFVTVGVVSMPTPLTPLYDFCTFARSCRVQSRSTMGIRAHPCLVSGPQPSIVSYFTHPHP